MSASTEPVRPTHLPGVDEFIERCGVVLGSIGLTRSSGRLLGWLLVCEPAEQSIDQLSRDLSASRGGLSVSTRELTRAGFVERVGVAGSRKAYYRLAPGGWRAVLDTPPVRATDLRVLAEAGLSLLDRAPQARQNRLLSMYELFAFLETEFLAAPRRYHHEKGLDHG